MYAWVMAVHAVLCNGTITGFYTSGWMKNLLGLSNFLQYLSVEQYPVSATRQNTLDYIPRVMSSVLVE